IRAINQKLAAIQKSATQNQALADKAAALVGDEPITQLDRERIRFIEQAACRGHATTVNRLASARAQTEKYAEQVRMSRKAYKMHFLRIVSRVPHPFHTAPLLNTFSLPSLWL